LSNLSITVAIPTYNREGVLLNTIRHVLAQGRQADEILVVDQTVEHQPQTKRQLRRWNDQGTIRWLRQKVPSLSAARNRALVESKSDIIIFLDDDVILSQDFIKAHEESYSDPNVKIVSGQIIAANRPVQHDEIDDFELGFPLSHCRPAWIKNMGGGNFSVYCSLARAIGGFDERFYKVAYREDSDFLYRFCARYDCLARYVPAASLVHLASMAGGCESRRAAYDPFACSGSVGEHYFTLRNMKIHQAIGNCIYRMLRPRCGKFVAARPWLFPLMGCREAIAFLLATMQVVRGPSLLTPEMIPDY